MQYSQGGFVASKHLQKKDEHLGQMADILRFMYRYSFSNLKSDDNYSAYTFFLYSDNTSILEITNDEENAV